MSALINYTVFVRKAVLFWRNTMGNLVNVTVTGKSKAALAVAALQVGFPNGIGLSDELEAQLTAVAADKKVVTNPALISEVDSLGELARGLHPANHFEVYTPDLAEAFSATPVVVPETPAQDPA